MPILVSLQHSLPAEGQAPRTAFRGEWRTDGRAPSAISIREKLDVVLIVRAATIRGAVGHQHLLRARLLCKFYAPDNPRYAAKGVPLGAITLRCRIGSASEVSDVTYDGRLMFPWPDPAGSAAPADSHGRPGPSASPPAAPDPAAEYRQSPA